MAQARKAKRDVRRMTEQDVPPSVDPKIFGGSAYRAAEPQRARSRRQNRFWSGQASRITWLRRRHRNARPTRHTPRSRSIRSPAVVSVDGVLAPFILRSLEAAAAKMTASFWKSLRFNHLARDSVMNQKLRLRTAVAPLHWPRCSREARWPKPPPAAAAARAGPRARLDLHRQRRPLQPIRVPRHLADQREAGLQGGFDLGHKSGFYVGTWASNISMALRRQSGRVRRASSGTSTAATSGRCPPTSCSTSASSTTGIRAPTRAATPKPNTTELYAALTWKMAARASTATA